MKHKMELEAIERIREALDSAATVLSRFIPGTLKVEYKRPGHAVTEADRAVNEALQRILHRDGEGWLSEESADDLSRLNRKKVWIVDPLDGTREFVKGIPEWCVSVALIVDGAAIAGGIVNPATEEVFLGSPATGLRYIGKQTRANEKKSLAGAVVLASRTEVERGEWKRFEKASFLVRPMGSVAYKLACVAAGLADATWTLTPKCEWDVAAGVALVEAAGGFVNTLNLSRPTFNKKSPCFPGLLASTPGLRKDLIDLLRPDTNGQAQVSKARTSNTLYRQNG